MSEAVDARSFSTSVQTDCGVMDDCNLAHAGMILTGQCSVDAEVLNRLSMRDKAELRKGFRGSCVAFEEYCLSANYFEKP